MKRFAILLIVFLLIHCPFLVVGQLYSFTHYNLDKGLPQSTVFSVFEDQRGYLWVGTESGVACFNGLTFTVFDRNSGLPGNTVRSIAEDSNGNLWFGTENGIGIFDGHSWRTITSDNGLHGAAIIKIVPDEQGRMWIATNNAGVNVITINNDRFDIVNLNKDNGLAGNFVLDILHDLEGKTWIALIGGVNIISQENGSFKIIDLQESTFIPSNLVSCIEMDTNGNLWFGTLNAGAFQLVKEKERYRVIAWDEPKGLIDKKIWDIYCDNMGRVWFGSNENGLFFLENNVMHNITTQNGLPGNLIVSIYADRSENIWIGSMNGLSFFHGFHLVHFTQSDGLPGTQVLAVKAATDNSLWIGSDGRGLAKANLSNNKLRTQFFGSETGFTGKNVIALDFDGQGDLLIGTRGDGLARYQNGRFNYLRKHNGLVDNNINCVSWNSFGSIYIGTDLGYNEIREDKIYEVSKDDGLIHPEVETIVSDLNGIVWMGTMGGLVRLDIKTGVYRDFTKNNGLLDERVNALAVDKLNQIYIGTTFGIYRFNQNTDTITSFLSDNLNSRFIKSLLFYNDSTLLVGTTVGFNRIVFSSNLSNIKSIKRYDKTNGFIFSETNTNAISKDSRNTVWFGTVSGLTRYQPQLEPMQTKTPLVHITGIRLAFELVDWEEMGYRLMEWFKIPVNLKLKYNQDHVTFDFDGLYLSNPEKVSFRYKLEPFDKNWSPPTKGNSVTYPGLRDGKYTFLVSSSVDEISWSEPTIYMFVISPPFWKTYWFYISTFISLVALLMVYIRYREKTLIKEKEHLEEVVKERTAEVVAQKERIQEQKEEITASITYAYRIQQAVLPNIDILKQNTKDCFIFFKPRDIVSGDFYWIGRNDNHLIVTAADCTGHGVPGAFMSMLGISFMNKIVNEQKNILPADILEHLRANIISSLKQGDYEGAQMDGMDIALCVINLDTLFVNFAGSFNPAIVISNNQVFELRADRIPVGYHLVMEPFSSDTYQLKKGDCVYLFSDGYQDQMGGPEGRKFMKKNLRELLLSIHTKPFDEQREILEKTIDEWRISSAKPLRGYGQIDDMVIIGFSV